MVPNSLARRDGTGPSAIPSRTIPESKDEWNAFLVKYMSGDAHQMTFAVDDSYNAQDSQPGEQQHPGHDDFQQSPALTSPSFEADTLRPSESSNTPIASRNTATPDSDGNANQDPNIPNLRRADFLEGNQDQRRDMFTKAEASDPGVQSLTMAHVAQLNQEQKDADDAYAAANEADAKDDHEDLGDPGPSSRRRSRKIADASLEAVKEPYSIGSSSSSDQGNDGSTRSRELPRPSRKPKRSASPARNSTHGSAAGQSVLSPIDAMLLESSTNSSTLSASAFDFDYAAERDRVRAFYTENGYMPAPKQAPDAMRRRLRVIRRLGLERPDASLKQTLDRFTRLAVSIFKSKRALVTIIAKDRQIFLSQIGFQKQKSTSFEDAFCCHTVIGSGEACMVVPETKTDWRFRNNPLVKNAGPIQFYAGAPLIVGRGPKAAVIGSMCVIDDRPRQDFREDEQRLLKDLAECVVSEMELKYNQQATVEAAKLHQISVDFLRRSLQNRPHEIAGVSRGTETSDTASGSGKRRSGKDSDVKDEDVDLFDEACQEIRLALDAYAVAIVDLAQFHLFYPSYQTSSQGGSTFGSQRQSNASGYRSLTPARSSRRTSRENSSMREASSRAFGEPGDELEPYQKDGKRKAARQTYAVTDPMAAALRPQVLFIPTKSSTQVRKPRKNVDAKNAESLDVLGYSCGTDGFAFNFEMTPASRKIICDFIATNSRSVWYTRDDSTSIAQSITHLMPAGTETSLAMPVFGFDGQVAFAVVACWKDPLFTYPAGTIQFVETIAGSLLASVLKERLHRAERAQLNFAAAASHELRTPLHQINAAAALLRQALQPTLAPSTANSPTRSPSLHRDSSLKCDQPVPCARSAQTLPQDERLEAQSHLEVIEANGMALGQILENIIDTLDIGRMMSRGATTTEADGNTVPSMNPDTDERTYNFSHVMEKVVRDAIEVEEQARRLAGRKGSEGVEVILEVMPRSRGQWTVATDPGPLARALGKIIHNSCKFTDDGYIHITVQDISRDIQLPSGYDNSVKVSRVAIDIKDTGRGMTTDFLDREILKPFAKEDPFMQGSGLGLGLAQRLIEILGGKLAIKSVSEKGTLVHVEIPLHILNTDNDSDQEKMEQQMNAALSTTDAYRSYSPVRQDGIYLHGFDNGDAGTRRVGRVLQRQLKLRSCRVTEQIQYASLIVIGQQPPDEGQLINLVNQARKGCEVMSLAPAAAARMTASASRKTSISVPSILEQQVSFSSGDDQVTVTRLFRPLLPSVVRRISQPVKGPPPLQETYVSDVVGGDAARAERQTEAVGTTSADVQDMVTQVSAQYTSDMRAARSSAQSENLLPSPAPSRSPILIPHLVDSDWSLSSDRSASTSSLAGDTAALASGLEADAPELGKSSASPQGDIPESDFSDTNMESPVAEKSDAEAGTSHFLPPMRPPVEHHISDPQPYDAKGKEGAEDPGRPSLQTAMSDMNLNPQSQAAAEDDGTLRVLVVEDNAVNRRILTTMLKRTACHYAEAVDGNDAVKKFLTFQPDLVLLDINMPGKDGFQASAEMRSIETTQARSKRAKIVAVTALGTEHHKRKGLLECGIDEWRTKPVSLKVLKEDVEKMRI